MQRSESAVYNSLMKTVTLPGVARVSLLPEALLSVANCQMELKDAKGARRTLDELLKTYPKTEAAQAGKERLASLK